MDVSFHFQHLESSEALKDHARQKVEKLSAHFDQSFDAVVHFKVERIHQIVEFVINVGGDQFVASEKHEDMYAAIDLAEDKLEKMIRRHKEKNLDRRRSAP